MYVRIIILVALIMEQPLTEELLCPWNRIIGVSVNMVQNVWRMAWCLCLNYYPGPEHQKFRKPVPG